MKRIVDATNLKQILLSCCLFSFFMFAACSDDENPSEPGGKGQAKVLVSNILVTEGGSSTTEWNFEYDNQNRVIEVAKIRKSNTSYYYISYEGNQILQKSEVYRDGSYDCWQYDLDAEGRVQQLRRWEEPRDDEYGWNKPEYDDIEYFTYDDEGYLTFVNGKDYDGEDKTLFWENGDWVKLQYTGDIPEGLQLVYDKKVINNPNINMDFNHFLLGHELTKYFIDNDFSLKAFGFFGKRGKHCKTGEGKRSYEYTLDEDGYITEITERVQDSSKSIVYTISYIKAK